MRSFLQKAFIVFALIGLFPVAVFADTLYISPSSGSYAQGKSFSARIFVSSVGQPINAVSGVLSFPQDRLQVVSISKDSSIITLWVQEPSFSNTQGTVSFEGVVPNPGFTGSSGRILTINFRVVDQGDAPLRFTAGSVLANDGSGTNILRTLGTAMFTLGGVSPRTEVVPIPSERTDSRTPPAPDVVSSTHPEEKKWYRENKAAFSWTVGPDIEAARVLLGKQPTSEPTVVYEPPIGSREIPDIDDGIWYFHVQLQNQYGWGGVTHYQIRIDGVAPENFTVKEVGRQDLTNPKVKFTFTATDNTSGISYYTVQIDDGEPEKWQDDGTGIYETPVLSPGRHTLLARVYDEAGNFTVASVDFSVQPIDSPRIDSYTEEVTTDTPFVVRGVALPNVEVIAFAARGDDEPIRIESTRADNSGSFSLASNHQFERGAYRLWVIAKDKRGAESDPSASKAFVVRVPLFFSIGESVIKFLAILVPIVSLSFGLVFVWLYFSHKIGQFRKGVRKELRDVESIVDRAFELLKEDIEDSIRLLERAKTRRHLTKEEDHLIERFRQNLADAERAIQKEIHDVEKKMGDR